MFERLYSKHAKKLPIIPLIGLLIAAYLAFVFPGVKLGIDFTGGVVASFETNKSFDPTLLEQKIRETFSVHDVRVIPLFVGEKKGGIIEMGFPATRESVPTMGTPSSKELSASIEEFLKKEIGAENVVVREITPTLGAQFWGYAIWIAWWAFFLLAISVFIFFRKILPSIIILGSAIYDSIFMLAFMAIAGIPLGLATLVILLMQAAYSIDTDILLSTYALKRRGKLEKRIARAAKTGLNMTGTTFVAMLFVYAVGLLTRNLTVMRIANVMMAGLIGDILITWFLNAPIWMKVVGKHASTA